MLLTPDQLYQIQKIIAEHHSAFMANAIGPNVIPKEVLDKLKVKGLIKDSLTTIGQAYTYGQLLGTLPTKKVASMSYAEFLDHVRQHPVPLTAVERGAVAMAEQNAAQYCRGLGNKIDLATGAILIEADRKLRARMEADIRTEVAENIARRETVEQLKSELGWATGDWTRDLKRIAITEKVTAMSQGTADFIKKEHGADSYVAKRTMPDACSTCKRLYDGPNGPRVFKLATLEAHGTNVGKKQADWQAVVGSTHPHCQCVLIHVPAGWGWNDEGDLVPGGKADIYESEKDLAESLRAEDDLQKAFVLQDSINYQGIPIAIENKAGSIRTWAGPNGSTGQTKMQGVSYGYAKGTLGADGDEIDVFVGPDPRAKNAYVIEQQNPGTGQWDEAKCFLGFPNKESAERAYRAHYDNPDSFFLTIQEMDLEAFKRWIAITRPRQGEMNKAQLEEADGPKLIILLPEDLQKAPPVGGKYIRRVPYYVDGHRKYRYYYTESAIARDVQAGETVKMGKQFATVQSVAPDGTVHLTVGSTPIQVAAHQWDSLLATHYGEAYFSWAEKRASQSVNAVLKHVPREELVDLKGATDQERMTELKTRVPSIFNKLQKSFERSGVNPFRAKQILATSLERRGWEPEARAAVIGNVITAKNKDYRTTIRAAENLAGGGNVKIGHVAAVTEIAQAMKNPERDEVAEVAKQAEKELATLSSLLAKARDGSAEDRAAALAAALGSTAILKLNMIAQAYPGLSDKAVEPARKAMLEVPALAPEAKPKNIGSRTQVYVSGEGGYAKPLKAQYKLMEADELIASHDPKTFNRRAEYPEGVQERAYHRDKAEQAKVVGNAQKLIPSMLVNTNPDAVNGPPIIGPDNVVLGGNSRTMSAQLAYAKHPDKAQELRDYLKEHAHEAGFTEADVAQFKNPVLVRVVEDSGKTQQEKQLLVRQMNESFTQEMDPRTAQVAWGRKLNDEAVQQLAEAMNPGETLVKFLATKRAQPFIASLQKAGIIDQRNANRYFEKGTKRLNTDGKTLVARILVGRAIGDADLLSSSSVGVVNNLAQAVPYLEQAKAHGEGYDLTNDLRTALNAYNGLQYRVDTESIPPLSKDMSDERFKGLFNQQEMFGGSDPVTQSPRAMSILELLIRKTGPQQFAGAFKTHADNAAKNPENQGSIAGLGTKTAQQVWNEAAEQHLRGKGAETKEVADEEDTEKAEAAGHPLYIGPKGGKWANPEHTEHWEPGTGAVTRLPVKKEVPKQLDLFSRIDTTAVVATDPALTQAEKEAPETPGFAAVTKDLTRKVADPGEWALPAGARVADPWKAPEIDPNAVWSHPDYGTGKGAAPWQQSEDWAPDFHKYDYILVNSSGGKDSQCQLTRIVENADRVGYPRKNIIVVHADLGRVEWEGSKSVAQQQAEAYGLRFEVVKRSQNDLVDQIAERHGDLTQRGKDVQALADAGIKTWGALARAQTNDILKAIGTSKGSSKWDGEHRAKELTRAGQKKLERDIERHKNKIKEATKKRDSAKQAVDTAQSDIARHKAQQRYEQAAATLQRLANADKPENWPIDFGKAIPWPSMDARFCTSDHKRAEIKKFITKLSQEYAEGHGKKGAPKILDTMGIRAQESPGRAKMDNFARTEDSSKRVVDKWYPIHRWSEKKVWETIKKSGVAHHRAYDLGMRRLSCCFCVFAMREDLLIAATHNPELFKTYLALENKVGTDFSPNLSLHDLATEIEKRRSEGYELNTLAEWIKKALGLQLDIDLIKAAIGHGSVKAALLNLLLEEALRRLAAKGQKVEAVVLDWKPNGLCVHLDSGNDSFHVSYVRYPEAYNASLAAAGFARAHQFPVEENNQPAPEETVLQKGDNVSPDIGALSSRAGNRGPGPGLGVNYFIPVPKKWSPRSKKDGYFPGWEDLFREVQGIEEVGALHVDKDVYDFQEPLLILQPIELSSEYVEAHEEGREGTAERNSYVKQERFTNAGRPKNTVERTPVK